MNGRILLMRRGRVLQMMIGNFFPKVIGMTSRIWENHDIPASYFDQADGCYVSLSVYEILPGIIVANVHVSEFAKEDRGYTMGICRFTKQNLELARSSHISGFVFFSYPTSFQLVFRFLNALLGSHISQRGTLPSGNTSLPSRRMRRSMAPMLFSAWFLQWSRVTCLRHHSIQSITRGGLRLKSISDQGVNYLYTILLS